MKYKAFISYRHADNHDKGRLWANWLHRALETYEIPADLVGQKNRAGDPIPDRIYPVFRDEEELSADADLSSSITGALDQTETVVVLCSPRAVASPYVDQEIDYFKKLGRQHHIICAILDGEPHASWNDGVQARGFSKDDECFPAPLHFEYGDDGHPTDKRAEPIAADFRIHNDDGSEAGWADTDYYKQALEKQGLPAKDIDQRVADYRKQHQLMLLKIIAGIIGVPLGMLSKRDKEYQLEIERKKAKTLRRWLGAVAGLAIAATGAGIYAFIQQQEAIAQRDRAETMLAQVRSNLSFMSFSLRDTIQKYVPTEEHVKITEKIDELVDLLEEESTGSIDDQRNIAASFLNKADVILASSDQDPSQAEKLVTDAIAIFEQLAADNPTHAVIARDLSVAYEKEGVIAERLGRSADALSAFQKSLSLLQGLVEAYPDNSRFARDLAIFYDRFGDMQVQFGFSENAMRTYASGLAIRTDLLSKDPENPLIKRELSLSHERLLDIYQRVGASQKAAEHSASLLEIRRKLVAEDPLNIQFQRDLSIALDRAGDLAQRGGNKDTALAFYTESKQLRQQIVDRDAGNFQYKQDLAAMQDKIGDVQLMAGDYGAARQSYQDAQSERRAMQAARPEEVAVQQGIATSLEKLADVDFAMKKYAPALSAYHEALIIRQSLAAEDPANRIFQLTLLNAHGRIGDSQLAAGNIDAADTAYRAALTLAEALVAKDQVNNLYQHRLSGVHHKIGLLKQQQGKLDIAFENLNYARHIREQLRGHDPANFIYRRDVVQSFMSLARLLELQAYPKRSLLYYNRAVDTLNAMIKETVTSTQTLQEQLGVAAFAVGRLEEKAGTLAAATSAYEGAATALEAAYKVGATSAQNMINAYSQSARTLALSGQAEAAATTAMKGIELYRTVGQSQPTLQAEMAGNAFSLFTVAGDSAAGRAEHTVALQYYQIAGVLLNQLEAADTITGQNLVRARSELALKAGQQYIRTGNGKQGLALIQQAQDQAIALDPADPEFQIVLAENKGDALIAAGRLQAAKASYRKTLVAVRKQASGVADTSKKPNHMLRTTDILSKIGRTELQMGQIDTAVATYLDVLQQWEKFLAAGGPDVPISQLENRLDRIAQLAPYLQKSKQALAYFEYQAALRKLLADTDTKNVNLARKYYAALRQVGDTYLNQNQPNLALSYYDESLKGLTALYDENAPDVALMSALSNINHSIGNAHFLMRNPSQAFIHMRRGLSVLENMQAIYPDNNDLIIRMADYAEYVADMFARVQDSDKAISLYDFGLKSFGQLPDQAQKTQPIITKKRKILISMSRLLMAQNQQSAALERYRQVVALDEAHYDQNPDAQASMKNLVQSQMGLAGLYRRINDKNGEISALRGAEELQIRIAFAAPNDRRALRKLMTLYKRLDKAGDDQLIKLLRQRLQEQATKSGSNPFEEIKALAAKKQAA